MTNGDLRIGQVASRTGLSVRLIRHYEKMGLIPPPGRREAEYASAGYRLFGEEHVQRLEFIALARSLDLPLREIGELLGYISDGCCNEAQPHLRSLLGDKLQEVDRRITMLQDLRHRLQEYYHHLAEGAECDETCRCAPGATPIQCAFGEAAPKVAKGKSGPGPEKSVVVLSICHPNGSVILSPSKGSSRDDGGRAWAQGLCPPEGGHPQPRGPAHSYPSPEPRRCRGSPRG